MYVRGEKKQTSKLDSLLRAGATKMKQPSVDIDKAISSTTHRLLKEKIEFTKSPQRHDSSEQYKNSGFIILEPAKECEALTRVCQRTRNSHAVIGKPLLQVSKKILHKRRKNKQLNKLEGK